MATEAELRAYANNGRDWAGLCQALMWNYCDQFGSAPVAYASAFDAFYASNLESTDVFSAPPGAFVYYDVAPPYGHVSVTVDNDREGMASTNVSEDWAANGTAGEVDVGDYMARTGAYPLGWSYTNGANDFHFESEGGSTPPPTDEGEVEMRYIWTQNRGGALVGESGYYPYGDPEYANSGNAIFGSAGLMNDRQWDVARQDAINRGNDLVARIADEVIRRTSGAQDEP